MTLGQFTETKLLLPRLLSDRQENVIIELSNRLERAKRVESSEALMQALLQHASLNAAVFDGVAFPHVRGRAVKELSLAVGLSEQGVRWGAQRASVVHTLALFAVPLCEGQRYLSLVLAFASFLKDEAAFSALRRCVQPEEMLGVLSQVRVVRTDHSSAIGSGPLTGRWK